MGARQGATRKTVVRENRVSRLFVHLFLAAHKRPPEETVSTSTARLGGAGWRLEVVRPGCRACRREGAEEVRPVAAGRHLERRRPGRGGGEPGRAGTPDTSRRRRCASSTSTRSGDRRQPQRRAGSWPSSSTRSRRLIPPRPLPPHLHPDARGNQGPLSDQIFGQADGRGRAPRPRHSCGTSLCGRPSRRRSGRKGARPRPHRCAGQWRHGGPHSRARRSRRWSDSSRAAHARVRLTRARMLKTGRVLHRRAYRAAREAGPPDRPPGGGSPGTEGATAAAGFLAVLAGISDAVSRRRSSSPAAKPSSGHAIRKVLKSYEGTMLFVSHDRTFLRGLATRVLELGGEGTDHDGPMPYLGELRRVRRPHRPRERGHLLAVATGGLQGPSTSRVGAHLRRERSNRAAAVGLATAS